MNSSASRCVSGEVITDVLSILNSTGLALTIPELYEKCHVAQSLREVTVAINHLLNTRQLLQDQSSTTDRKRYRINPTYRSLASDIARFPDSTRIKKAQYLMPGKAEGLVGFALYLFPDKWFSSKELRALTKLEAKDVAYARLRVVSLGFALIKGSRQAVTVKWSGKPYPFEDPNAVIPELLKAKAALEAPEKTALPVLQELLAEGRATHKKMAEALVEHDLWLDSLEEAVKTLMKGS